MFFVGLDHPISDEQPLLDCCYLDDGLYDGGIIVPTDPLAIPTSEINDNFQRSEVVDDIGGDESGDNGGKLLILCIEKIGLGIGILIGAFVQMATLAGNVIIATIWEAEDVHYAIAAFVIWCFLMTAMFFVAFVLLRGLVRMSLRMMYQTGKKGSNQQTQQPGIRLAVENPTTSPTPSPSMFPTFGRSLGDRSRRRNEGPRRDEHKVLDDIIWYMKLNYVLGVSLGISLSWIVINSTVGHHRVSLVYNLLPTLIGLAWFLCMKWSGTTSEKDSVCCSHQISEDV